MSGEGCGGGADPDDCAALVPELLVPGASLTFSGDNGTATATNDFVPESPFAGAPVLWHAFTTQECTDIRVAFCGPDPAWGTVFGFLATDCPADSLVYVTTFNTTDCGDGNHTCFFDELAPGTYNVPVVPVPGTNSVGPYTVVVSAGDRGAIGEEVPIGSAPVLFPVPANGEVTVRWPFRGGMAEVSLFDAAGRCVRMHQQAMVHGANVLDLSGLPVGPYTLRFAHPDGVSHGRVIIR